MATKYLLPCQCGEKLSVDLRQAGEQTTCVCGATLDIPTLRELRQAEPAAASRPERSSDASWSTAQGLLFAGGTALALIAFAVHAYLLFQRIGLDTTKPDISDIEYSVDLQDLPPERAWEMWQHFRDLDLGQRPTPGYLARRASAALLNRYLVASLGVGIIGIVTAISAFFVRPTAPRGT